MCPECLERLKAMQKCVVCGKDYEDDGGPDGEGKFSARGDQALALIQQARLTGNL